MLLFLSITGIILSVILLYFNGRNFRSAIYLGSFFFLVSYYSFLQYVLIYSKSVLLVSVFYLNFAFLGYLIGPMLYWYVRSVLTDNSSLRKSDLLHLLPAVLIIIITLPYLFGSYSLKVDTATGLVEDLRNIRMIRISSLYDSIPRVVVYMSRPILVLVYALWSAGMLIRFLWQRKTSSVFSGQQYMIKWLSVLLGFLFILVISHLIIMAEVYLFDEFNIFSALSILTVISGIGLAGLLISPFFFPDILYGLPRFPKGKTIHEPGKESISASTEQMQRRISGFESDYLDHIKIKLDSCMQVEQPFLHSTCNLAFIAKLTQIPVHHLSYYFREVKKQTFNDFRNELRVNHAKELIREGKARELTLEAIGLLSGFSTRNTFFTAFKKVEGISPSLYSSRSSEMVGLM